jgi:plasmid maintenance system antidote protein VapI
MNLQNELDIREASKRLEKKLKKIEKVERIA